MVTIFKQTGLKFLILTLILVVIDQVTKSVIFNSLALYEDITILPIFDITHVHNYGAAFSFLSDAGGWQRYFFTCIAIMISVLIIYWMYKTPKEQKLLLTSYALILSGAIGNVWDRIQLGYVIDFLHFYYQGWHFPAFNVADIAISCGAFLMILDAWFEHKQSKAQQISEQ